ncbi:UDP-glucuronosyltransferase 2C1-like [Liolophura sinensis]|uniref:UDP-glucuronosyltransferase 2C1-like n=1 Tax=Liolophura sinensis TaxID=3198878 RepID=UPI0031597D77
MRLKGLALILCGIGCYEGAKILLLTGAVYSHCAEISGVGHALLDKGHSVFILLDETFDHKNCFNNGRNGSGRIQPIVKKLSPEVETSGKILGTITEAIKADHGFSFFTHLSLVRKLSLLSAVNLFYDQVVMQRLKKEKFDLAIVDTVPFAYCIFLLPMKLGIPYVGISSNLEDFVSGRPFLPSIVPNTLSKFTDSMTFIERLSNAAKYVGVNLLGRFSQAIDVLEKYDPDISRQGLINIVANCKLFLYNYDPVLSYPVPQMPNHVFIGGISARPAHPLPMTYTKLYNNSPKGVVLVTFGGTVGSLSAEVDEKLIPAFRKLDATVLWKHAQEGDDDNIKRFTWVPQNDLLGHPQTKVFVSQCGTNAVFEALYHGVPLVCTPIFADQFYNAERVKHWNVGKSLPLLTSTGDDIYEAIKEVMIDPTYKMSMKRASEMYHSQPMTARERAAFWVEHVLKFGGDHLRSNASEMSTFVFMGYDIVCFLLVILIFTVFLSLKCIFVLLKFCHKNRKKEKNS